MSGDHQLDRAQECPVELVADLHAGVLDPEAADPRVSESPEAGEVLEALEATRSDLAHLPGLTIPADVDARIASALEWEARTPPAERPSVPPDSTERGRTRRDGMARIAVIATVLALSGLALLVTPEVRTGGDELPAALPETSSAPDGWALSPEQLSTALHTHDLGPLADAHCLAECLHAHGADGGPLGASPVTVDHRPAELLILPGPANDHRLRLLVVGPACGRGTPDTRADTLAGR